MRKGKRKQRQEMLAKLFYEMGMDLELVSKISGIDISKIEQKKIKKRNNRFVDKC